MHQKPVQRIESECKKCVLFVENDTPLGELHDFLLSLKGHVVDRMIKAQQEDCEMAEAQKKLQEEQEKAEEPKEEAKEESPPQE